MNGGELGHCAGQGAAVVYRHFHKAGLQHIQAHGGVPVAYLLWDTFLCVYRCYFQRAHQVVPCGGQQLKFVIHTAAALAGQALAVMAFR